MGQLLYRVLFKQDDKIYETYAQYVSDESLVGFVEIEEFIFTDLPLTQSTFEREDSDVLEKIFSGVKRCYIPVHLVLRIDEVSQIEVLNAGRGEHSNVKPFPVSHLNSKSDEVED